jgi:hypothetical protein
MAAHRKPIAAGPGRPLQAQARRAAGARLLAVAAFLLLVACATEAKYRTYVDGFVGQPADQLYAVWGAPLRSAPTPEGG